MSDIFWESVIFLFALLNPFLLSIYLMDLIETMDFKQFVAVLLRGTIIATITFTLFAVSGDRAFSAVGARFSAFLVFGGVLFLILALRYALVGSDAIRSMRGKAEHVAGSIAMPFMIGPGTVSASVIAGTRLELFAALLSILLAMAGVFTSLLILKLLFDYIKTKYTQFAERYIDIVGRLSALFMGTIAIEMLMQGLELWIKQLKDLI